ncbi:MAG TPA: hypothetical protein DCO86_02260, partial [Spirochaetaceae bacterium]|nr:hypothetical protein [Spirochaetaceae bacterium]
SYIAEKYGKDTINAFHSWKESGSDLEEYLRLNVADRTQIAAGAMSMPQEMKEEMEIARSEYLGDINRITSSILKGKSFKDEYVDFLCQCMSSISDDVAIKGSMKKGFICPGDWGFTQDMLDYAIKNELRQNGEGKMENVESNRFVISDAAEGKSVSDLPELSFVVHKWTQIPDSICLTGNNIKCFAIWF